LAVVLRVLFRRETFFLLTFFLFIREVDKILPLLYNSVNKFKGTPPIQQRRTRTIDLLPSKDPPSISYAPALGKN